MPILEFKSRCRNERSLVSERKIWESRCGRYRIVHSRCLFGRRAKKSQRIPDVFYAEIQRECFEGHNGWHLVSKHRTTAAALRALLEENGM